MSQKIICWLQPHGSVRRFRGNAWNRDRNHAEIGRHTGRDQCRCCHISIDTRCCSCSIQGVAYWSSRGSNGNHGRSTNGRDK
ncbi:predicted protein [Plenodomus lingam JN3]|uniref:Predicted protein n=1 Tax=Leptosphaeria maculans (strain JN3 / isolate v23.1.3 / race Av1-4-5-6-7-8) TaxID=985895 RepID=E4ZU30_LEPMJ|nr:predicted protein [Plenodomus lingam JN3]CBX94740.1 predicted protein [Plenodomus lingam JN3]